MTALGVIAGVVWLAVVINLVRGVIEMRRKMRRQDEQRAEYRRRARAQEVAAQTDKLIELLEELKRK